MMLLQAIEDDYAGPQYTAATSKSQEEDQRMATA